MFLFFFFAFNPVNNHIDALISVCFRNSSCNFGVQMRFVDAFAKKNQFTIMVKKFTGLEGN